jgi:transposase
MNKTSKEFSKNLKVACADIWKPFINSIKVKAKNAINVIDRFHVKQKMNKALDKVRAREVKRLKKEKQDPVLTKSRWCFLKKRGNLTKKQGIKLRELLKMNLTTVKAYLLIEQFDQFWEYKSPTWAGKFLEAWCAEVLKANIPDLEPNVNMLKSRKDLLLNYFRANKEYNSGIVEGLNRNLNLSIRKAYGFRTFQGAKTCLFHQYGKLPEEIFTHRFW